MYDQKVLSNELNILARKYSVSDLITENSRVIFVLESPHINEFKSGYPASGLTGKAMTRILSSGKNSSSLGEYISSHKTSLGVLNCSNIPLGRTFYEGREEQSFSVLDIFDRIRRRDPDIFTYTFLRQYYALKMRYLHPFSVRIYCGKVAEMFKKDCYEFGWVVPHPSQGNWDKNKEQVLEVIKDAIAFSKRLEKYERRK